MSSSRDLYVVSGMGRDVTGLVSLVTSIISDANGNIIDLHEAVLHGLFSIFLTVDLSGARISGEQFVSKLQAVAHQSGLQIIAERHRLVRRLREKRLMRLVLLGPDHPGIVSAATFVLANNGVNIERALMISRGELFAMEMLLDRGSSPVPLPRIEENVADEMKKVEIRCFFREDVYGKRKRLLVFVVGNILDEGLRDELLAGATRGERERGSGAKALAGLGLDLVERITAGLRLGSEGEELLHALKRMGHRIGIIVPGFDLFLEPLRRYTCIDHVCGNRLLVEGGKVTGELVKLVGDEDSIRSVISAMARDEGVGEEDTIVLGDAAPADIRIGDAGIRFFLDKAALNELLSSGAIAETQIPSLVGAFGPLS